MGDKTIIMAVDDNVMQLKIFQGILTPQYDIRVVKSASDALGLLKEVKVDLILLDIEMPNISGFEFLHDIRKIPRYMYVPIIIVSGHAEPDFLATVRNSSAAEVLIKPVQPEALIEAIEKALSSSPQNPFGL